MLLLVVGADDVIDGVVDAHLVERAPNEEDGLEHKDDTYPRSKFTEVLADSHFHGEQTEQSYQDQIGNEKRNGIGSTNATRRCQAGKTECEEDGQEDAQHPFEHTQTTWCLPSWEHWDQA